MWAEPDNYLAEMRFGRGFGIQGAVKGEHSAERRDGIGLKCAPVTFRKLRSLSFRIPLS